MSKITESSKPVIMTEVQTKELLTALTIVCKRDLKEIKDKLWQKAETNEKSRQAIFELKIKELETQMAKLNKTLLLKLEIQTKKYEEMIEELIKEQAKHYRATRAEMQSAKTLQMVVEQFDRWKDQVNTTLSLRH